MTFHFPLSSVLRLRESIEKREEVALQTIQLEVARVRHRIDELTEEMTRAWEERERALQKTVQANCLQTMQAEINAAVEARKILFETMQVLKRQRSVQMNNYKVAHSQRRMLTDLLAEKKAAYELQRTRLQQKALDDIAAARWQRS